ncbi:MAG: MFS transporter [Coriobacteriales bacterium]|jgi:MFS family permease|nr:MFS transporter [Coriobacteriales bacterium]
MTTTKKNGIISLCLCITVVACVQYGAVIVNPISAAMIQAMPEHAITTIMLVLTLPNFGLVLGSPTYAWLSRRFPTRTIIGIAGLGVAVFGTMPAFLGTDLPLILVCRLLFGFGAGILFAIPKVLVASNMNQKDSARWLGLIEVFGSIGMVVYQTAAGYLAMSGWHYPFYLHLVPLIAVVIVVFLLPKEKDPGSKFYVPTEGAVNARDTKDAKTGKVEKLPFFKKFPPVVFLYWVYAFMFLAGIFVLLSNIAILVTSNGYGVESDIGMILSTHTFVGMFGGLCFGFLFRKLGEWIFPFACLLGVISYFAVYFSTGLEAIYFGSGLVGFGAPQIMAAIYQRCGRTAAASVSALAVTIAIAAQNLSQVLEPYWMTALCDALGFNTADGRDPFLVFGIIISVFTVIAVIQAIIVGRGGEKQAQSDISSTETASG